MRLHLWHERGSLCLQLWVLWFVSPQEKQYLTLDRVWALSCLTYGVGLGPRNTFGWYPCLAAPRPAPGPVAPVVLRWVTEPAAPRGAECPDAGAGFLGCGLHAGPTGLRSRERRVYWVAEACWIVPGQSANMSSEPLYPEKMFFAHHFIFTFVNMQNPGYCHNL